jgi:hypothetical protein
MGGFQFGTDTSGGKVLPPLDTTTTMSGWLLWRHLSQAQIDELSDAFDPFTCKQ